MKFSIISFLTIFLSILLAGCDPTYMVDYKVINNTEESLKMVVDYFDGPSDTNVISSGTTLVIFDQFGIGMSTNDYVENLEMLPVGLSIFDNAGHSFNKIEEDLSNWKKFYTRKKYDGEGTVQLDVRPDDFE